MIDGTAWIKVIDLHDHCPLIDEVPHPTQDTPELSGQQMVQPPDLSRKKLLTQ